MRESSRGLIHGIAAYALWGIVPIYWKLLDNVAPVEVLAHRAIWGLLAFVAIAAVAGQLRAVRAAFADRRTVGRMAISGALLAVNWTVFVAAVHDGHLLDASLGYFINPLVSIALGTMILGERMRRLQWAAIALAGTAVGVLATQTAGVPWISLVLAGTFATYGLVRKTAPVESLVGSTVETTLMTPVAIGFLIYRGGGTLAGGDASTIALCVGTGAITAVPLLLFTSAARRLPLSTVGFLQYLAPTGQFLLAVLAFGEPLARTKLFCFVLIWAGLVLFTYDLRRALRPVPARPRGL